MEEKSVEEETAKFVSFEISANIKRNEEVETCYIAVIFFDSRVLKTGEIVEGNPVTLVHEMPVLEIRKLVESFRTELQIKIISFEKEKEGEKKKSKRSSRSRRGKRSGRKRESSVGSFEQVFKELNATEYMPEKPIVMDIHPFLWGRLTLIHSIEDFVRVKVSLPTPLFGERLRREINFVRIRCKSLENLPNEPFLKEKCENVWIKMKFMENEETSKLKYEHNKRIKFDKTETFIYDLTEPSKTRGLFENDSIKFEIHDRDPKIEEIVEEDQLQVEPSKEKTSRSRSRSSRRGGKSRKKTVIEKKEEELPPETTAQVKKTHETLHFGKCSFPLNGVIDLLSLKSWLNVKNDFIVREIQPKEPPPKQKRRGRSRRNRKKSDNPSRPPSTESTRGKEVVSRSSVSPQSVESSSPEKKEEVNNIMMMMKKKKKEDEDEDFEIPAGLYFQCGTRFAVQVELAHPFPDLDVQEQWTCMIFSLPREFVKLANDMEMFISEYLPSSISLRKDKLTPSKTMALGLSPNQKKRRSSRKSGKNNRRRRSNSMKDKDPSKNKKNEFVETEIEDDLLTGYHLYDGSDARILVVEGLASLGCRKLLENFKKRIFLKFCKKNKSEEGEQEDGVIESDDEEENVEDLELFEEDEERIKTAMKECHIKVVFDPEFCYSQRKYPPPPPPSQKKTSRKKTLDNLDNESTFSLASPTTIVNSDELMAHFSDEVMEQPWSGFKNIRFVKKIEDLMTEIRYKRQMGRKEKREKLKLKKLKEEQEKQLLLQRLQEQKEKKEEETEEVVAELKGRKGGKKKKRSGKRGGSKKKEEKEEEVEKEEEDEHEERVKEEEELEKSRNLESLLENIDFLFNIGKQVKKIDIYDDDESEEEEEKDTLVSTTPSFDFIRNNRILPEMTSLAILNYEFGDVDLFVSDMEDLEEEKRRRREEEEESVRMQEMEEEEERRRLELMEEEEEEGEDEEVDLTMSQLRYSDIFDEDDRTTQPLLMTKTMYPWDYLYKRIEIKKVIPLKSYPISHPYLANRIRSEREKTRKRRRINRYPNSKIDLGEKKVWAFAPDLQMYLLLSIPPKIVREGPRIYYVRAGHDLSTGLAHGMIGRLVKCRGEVFNRFDDPKKAPVPCFVVESYERKNLSRVKVKKYHPTHDWKKLLDPEMQKRKNQRDLELNNLGTRYFKEGRFEKAHFTLSLIKSKDGRVVKKMNRCQRALKYPKKMESEIKKRIEYVRERKDLEERIKLNEEQKIRKKREGFRDRPPPFMIDLETGRRLDLAHPKAVFLTSDQYTSKTDIERYLRHNCDSKYYGKKDFDPTPLLKSNKYFSEHEKMEVKKIEELIAEQKERERKKYLQWKEKVIVEDMNFHVHRRNEKGGVQSSGILKDDPKMKYLDFDGKKLKKFPSSIFAREKYLDPHKRVDPLKCAKDASKDTFKIRKIKTFLHTRKIKPLTNNDRHNSKLFKN